MKFTSILAIYFLFFAGSAFILLPFGVKTSDEVGGKRIPGQAESAPHSFNVKWHFGKAAILAAVLFAIFYANWAFGWITPDDLDFYNPPQQATTADTD
jgi:predicted secreted protein